MGERSGATKIGWFRWAAGLAGLTALVLIVRSVGPARIVETLRPALVWLPLVAGLELGRIASETVAAFVAFGPVRARIPRGTLFRANLIGQSLSALAPAPRVVNETLKATILAPLVGAPAAASVGFIVQAATLISIGGFSVLCAAAIFVLSGASVWFWATMIHAVVLVLTGIVLRATTMAEGPGRLLRERFPRLAERHGAFREHTKTSGLVPWGATGALLLNRALQVLQYGLAAKAVGIDVDVVRAFAVQGVNLVASAVGVFVPAGLGTTDGAFTLASDLLGTTAVKTASLALFIRCAQLLWLLVGALVMLLGPKAAPRVTTDEVPLGRDEAAATSGRRASEADDE